jgi:hypothetical protein
MQDSSLAPAHVAHVSRSRYEAPTVMDLATSDAAYGNAERCSVCFFDSPEGCGICIAHTPPHTSGKK